MRRHISCRVASASVFLAAVLTAPHTPAQTVEALQPVASVGPNSPHAQAQHYVVLVSLDGFRWDYPQRDAARHLLALGKKGAWAPQGMLPGYPAFSFPNRITLVTGLYPGHHGLIADNFLDPLRQARFSASDPRAVADPSWYTGIPLWSLAESAGMRSACLGWSGCQAKIAAFAPAYNQPDSAKLTGEARLRQVLDWFHLPAAVRPHLIAIEDPAVDSDALRFGPDAPQTRAAVQRADTFIGQLEAALDATRLPIDFVVVSDRGFAKPKGGWIAFDQFASLDGFETIGSLLYSSSEPDRDRLYNQLKHAAAEFIVYRRKDLPANLYLRQNPRIGDPVILATGPYALRAHSVAAGKNSTPGDPPTTLAPPPGIDGFDAQTQPEMKAIFFAAGPDIVEGKTLAPFENVNLYPWLAHLLGLTPPKTDGSLNILSGILRDGGEPGNNSGSTVPAPANQHPGNRHY
jgi:hypothetical protein